MQKSKLPSKYAETLAEYGLSGIDQSSAVLLQYERGEWFLREGDAIEYLYLLLSGRAKVCNSEEGGRNLLLCYYVSKGTLGDIELLMGRLEAISSVQAVSPVTCIGLPLSVYAPVLLGNLSFVLRLSQGLAEKLYTSVTNTTGIILRPFEARLCAYLVQNAQNGVFDERLTNVAEQLGVSYRHLLRCLKALCEEQLLQKGTGGYLLLNETELKKRAAG
jgi:CRP-like cAMP-binding protein